jgi:predicted Zn-dependent protease
MPTLTPERADEVIAAWLGGAEDVVAGWDNPAGPLFIGGKYAEADITMTGTGGGAYQSYGVTGCAMCSGSWCNGMGIDCA